MVQKKNVEEMNQVQLAKKLQKLVQEVEEQQEMMLREAGKLIHQAIGGI